MLTLLVAVLLLASEARAQQPNLLIVVTDDQRYDSLGVMPATRDHFQVTFLTAITTTPDCCPSRASILTGEYAHKHGVLTNGDQHMFAARAADSLGPWLQAAGYFTGLVGKYLNKYRIDDPVPPGWDEFHARVWDEQANMIGNGHTRLALRHFETGPVQPATPRNEVVLYEEVYATRLFAGLATRFIRRASDPAFNPEGKPWALLVATTAPHRPLIVEGRYQGAPVPAWQRPPSFQERDLSDKPSQVRTSVLSTDPGHPHGHVRTQKLRMLMSVDDLVSRLWNQIEGTGTRDATWGIFMADNGFLLGEHRLREKLFAYEESIRIPFRVAVPGGARRAIAGSLVSNLDIAPTLLELAGLEPRERFDGTSLVGLASGADVPCLCRRTLLLENWERHRWKGLRNHWWKYVQWPSGREELYNLQTDPYELENWAGRPDQHARVGQFRARVAALSGS